MYPAFPQLKETINDSQESKLSLIQLTEFYNELHKLGFAVVAKQRGKKYPHGKWQSFTKQQFHPTYQLNLQEQPYISGWCILTGVRSNRLFVVDIDPSGVREAGNDPEELYHEIQMMSPSEFVLATPTGGVHIYYRIPDEWEMLNGRTNVVKGLDTRGEGGLVVTLGSHNKYEDNQAESKGVSHNHEGAYSKLPNGVYDTVPDITEELYTFVKSKHRGIKVIDGTRFGNNAVLQNYGKSEQGNARIDAHMAQTNTAKEEVVIECLDAIFSRWGNDLSNDEWFQIWTSAYHGSPTKNVLHWLITNPNVVWKGGIEDKEAFQQRWYAHSWMEDGFTVASLFWIARKAGWLATTGYEIPSNTVEEIDVEYISDWLKVQIDIPNILLVESQTGSGKTVALKLLWESVGKPRTVVFVPTVKLATELTATLNNKHGIPATLYRDEDTGTHIGIENMRKAKFLVTTLQTFATKLYTSGIGMSSYGLVYIEEIDQLVAGFARGGGGFYNSHVKENEARLGFEVLRDAFEHSDYVWGVDATMSQVSSSLVTSTAHRPIRIIRNVRIKEKPPVKFVEDIEEAYQVAYKALVRGKKVVVVCDTANRAGEVYNLLNSITGTRDKHSILITRHTSQKEEVLEFMRDVNQGAKEYDLVVYNSIMGSGVSIVDVAPDVIVQIATYLTPKNNLQMINRYRKQQEVYCYYQASESLYGSSAIALLEEAKNRIDVESRLIRIDATARTDNAVLRSSLSSISVADEQLQKRSPKLFYQSLLVQDGREIEDVEIEASGVLQHNIKKVRALAKDQKVFISANWHTVRPISVEHPPEPEMTDLEVALGLHHNMIAKALQGNIPVDVEPEEVSKVVQSFVNKGFILSEFMTQEKSFNRAEAYMVNGDKALTSINNNISIIKAVALVRILFGTMDTVLTTEVLDSNYREFLNAVIAHRELYDSATERTREKFEVVYDHLKPKESAVKLAKVLLRHIGLRLKPVRVRTGGVDTRNHLIGNLDHATKFLQWRNSDNVDFMVDYSFSTTVIDMKIEERQSVEYLYREMTEEQRAEVANLILQDGLAFNDAVIILSTEDPIIRM